MSCIARGDMPGPGWRTIELCTTVSTSARAISGAMLRVADVGLDQLGAARAAGAACACRARRSPRTRVALEPRGEQRAEVAPDAGDQHPAARHYLRRLLCASAVRRASPGAAPRSRRGAGRSRRSSAFSSRRSSCGRGPAALERAATAREALPGAAAEVVDGAGESSSAPCVRSRWRSAEPSVAWTVRSTASRSSRGCAGALRHGDPQSRRSTALTLQPARSTSSRPPSWPSACSCRATPTARWRWPSTCSSGPQMFNHARGLWGYTGVAADGEPLTVQSTAWAGRARRSSARS